MTYKIQTDDVVRDATEEEIVIINARQATVVAEEEALATKAAAKQAVLDKLGLTADEVAALLG